MRADLEGDLHLQIGQGPEGPGPCEPAEEVGEAEAAERRVSSRQVTDCEAEPPEATDMALLGSLN